MDKEFDRPINIFTLPYYNNVNKQLEREVGDWLRANAYANPKRYSNDLRHQYASALYARNIGSDLTVKNTENYIRNLKSRNNSKKSSNINLLSNVSIGSSNNTRNLVVNGDSVFKGGVNFDVVGFQVENLF